MRRVLVVDDEENIRLVLKTLLKRHGYEVETADGGEAALALVDSFGPDVILTDVRMPKMGGLDLLATLKAKQNPATVIVMSAYGSVDLALEAMKAGAYDYVGKPFKPDEIVLALRKAEERETLRRENRALKEQIQKESQFESILAKSPPMTDIFRTITKIADYKTTVLITGRERRRQGARRARAAHALEPRRTSRSSPSTAAPSPRTSSRAELFGHKKGAFTDATPIARGLFEEADGGTLFLDEIGELPLNLQVKLLRALQEETIRRLGDSKDIKIDVRIIAATHRDLAAEAKAGRFREDLFYRLNVLPILIPPLRDAHGGRAVARRSLRHAQQRAPRDADPRASRPTHGSSSSSTPGPATSASSRTPSSARWSSATATSSTSHDLPGAPPRGARPRAGAARERRALDQEDHARRSRRS